VGSLNAPGGGWNPAALLERIGRLRELGVTAAAVHISGGTPAEWCDNAERYSVEIIQRLG
jgi:hypothetical protein